MEADIIGSGGSRISEGGEGETSKVGVKSYHLANYNLKTVWRWKVIGPRAPLDPLMSSEIQDFLDGGRGWRKRQSDLQVIILTIFHEMATPVVATIFGLKN